jgi:hypothetical protein
VIEAELTAAQLAQEGVAAYGGRYALHKTYIGPDGVITTDGRRLILSRYATNAAVPTHGFLLSESLRRAAAKLKCAKVRVVYKTAGRGTMTVTGTDERTGQRRAVSEFVVGGGDNYGTYPNVKQVLPPHPPGTLCVQLDAAYLMQAARALTRFVNERGYGLPGVFLLVRPPEKDGKRVGNVTISESPVDLLMVPDDNALAPHGAAALLMPIDTPVDELARALANNPLNIKPTEAPVAPEMEVQMAAARDAARKAAAAKPAKESKT